MILELVRPSRGHTTQPFANVIAGVPHAGEDYAYSNAAGEIFPEVYAAADGVVLFAGDARGLSWPNIMYVNPDFDRSDNVDSSGGNYTIIAHTDAAGNRIALTGYGHQEQIWVSAGDYVRAGQQIGVVGATGNSRGKHLHFDLVLTPFDVDDGPFYGRVDPKPYYAGSISYAGTITTQSSSTSSGKDDFLMALSQETQAGMAENSYLNLDSNARIEAQNRAILETLALVLPAVARIDTRAAENIDVQGRIEKNQALLLESQHAVETLAAAAATKEGQA